LSAFARSSFKKLFLIVCLAGLSWFATYVGMLDLIAANTGDVSSEAKAANGPTGRVKP
jgi:hypothetical protein